MDWRSLRVEDVETCFRLSPTLMGEGILPSDVRKKLWSDLLRAPGLHGTAITKRGLQGEEILTGFGASIFVDRQFALSELRLPRPGLNGRIMAQIAQGTALGLNRDSVEIANSGRGLNVVVLARRWDAANLNKDEAEEVRRYLAMTFVTVHAGFRFERILTELVDQQDRLFFSMMPTMRIHAELGGVRGLAGVEKDYVMADAGSILHLLFAGTMPRWYLRPVQQDLLLAALDGGTDEDLAANLHVTKAAVKRRWLMIYERVDATTPEVLADAGKGGSKGRGRQKRHLILAYVRRHPEELRPFRKTGEAHDAAKHVVAGT